LAFFGSIQWEKMLHISTYTVREVLSRLCCLIVGEEEKEAAIRPNADIVDSDDYRIVTAPVLAKLVHHEFMRSQRHGHPWSLLRVQLAVKHRGAWRKPLYVFLLQATRQVDFVSEIRPGVFLLLLTQTGDAPDLILQRLTTRWRSEHPDVEVDAAQHNFPKAGDPDAIFKAWNADDSEFETAA
jgi:hypothetical protein